MPKNPRKAAKAAEKWKTDPEYRAKSRMRKKRWYARHKDTERNKKTKQKDYKARSDRQRIRIMAQKYGITPDDFNRMLVLQDFKCAICKAGFQVTWNVGSNAACIDHCHTTGLVRGLLCLRCNFGIGYFRDDPDIAGCAVDYLRRHRA